MQQQQQQQQAIPQSIFLLGCERCEHPSMVTVCSLLPTSKYNMLLCPLLRCTGGTTSTDHASPSTSTGCTQVMSGTSTIRRIMTMTTLLQRCDCHFFYAQMCLCCTCGQSCSASMLCQQRQCGRQIRSHPQCSWSACLSSNAIAAGCSRLQVQHHLPRPD